MIEEWCDEVIVEKQFEELKELLKGYDVKARHPPYEIIISKENLELVAKLRIREKEIILRKPDLKETMLKFGEKYGYKKLIKCWREK